MLNHIKHAYSGQNSDAVPSHERDYTTYEGKLRIYMAGAIAALCQNATHPADINAAVSFLRSGLSLQKE